MPANGVDGEIMTSALRHVIKGQNLVRGLVQNRERVPDSAGKRYLAKFSPAQVSGERGFVSKVLLSVALG